eukprot:NODE_7_length_48057_cov_0.322240.p9 type:complete len:375 gc:universal NODE_7_length_48057_cov_0.322240:170-1294(+)
MFSCYICLESLKNAEMCVKCTKMACSDCLKKWNHHQCPHCRQLLQSIKVPWVADIQLRLKDMCHHNAPLNYYCCTCNCCACAECVLQTHRSHVMERVSTRYELEKENLEMHKSQLLQLYNIYSVFVEEQLKIKNAISSISDLLLQSPPQLLNNARDIIQDIQSTILDVSTDHVVPKESFNFNYSNSDGELLYSPTFTSITGLEWRLKIYPKGNTQVSGKSVSIFLELVKDPFNISNSRQISYFIKMNQHQRHFTSAFRAGESWGYNKFAKITESGEPNFPIIVQVELFYANIMEYCRDATLRLKNKTVEFEGVRKSIEHHVDKSDSNVESLNSYELGLAYQYEAEEESIEQDYPMFDLTGLLLDQVSTESFDEN